MWANEPTTYSEFAVLASGQGGAVSPIVAPDGLPVVTAVDGIPAAPALLAHAAAALGVSGTADFTGTPLDPVALALADALRRQRIQRMRLEGGEERDVVVLPVPLRSLAGRTLLERIFHPELTPGHVTPDTRVAWTPTVPAYGAAPAEPVLPVPKFDPGVAYLALPVDGSVPIICQMRRSAIGWPEHVAKRTFAQERLDAIPASELELALPYRTGRIAASDHSGYLDLVANCADYGVWVVSRRAVAEALAAFARSLAALHKAGEVHGDLKPSNVLLTVSGPAAIDSLDLRTGERAAAMTRGWAAPEQILGTNVSPQTDIYAIGLHLLELICGVLYGEESQVAIPVGGRALERHTLLRNPGVFVDATEAPIAASAVEPWRGLIERCLRFEPADRFADVAEVADAVAELASADTLTGEYRVPLAFGRRSTVRAEGGEAGPGWLV
ncbi:MAG TPA: hypothetical protein VKT77_10820 [Chthonomonadaceae bacterium]|nr:hypothetical protein [Chthonomonadaceae bacterium]